MLRFYSTGEEGKSKMHNFIRARNLILAGIVFLTALLLFGTSMRAGGESQSFGHAIPAFEDVFIKLFKLEVSTMSMDQLKTVSAQLSDQERAAISYFLGPEGHDKVKEGLPQEKQDFLEEKYQTHTEVPPEFDFRKVFPHVLAVADNNLTLEQNKQVVDALTEEEIASQSFYLGEDGRAKFFSEISEDRVKIILDRTGDWLFIDTGKRKYKLISDYTSIMYKQERLGNKLQDVEKILVKFREKPKGIYMKWLEGPWKGRELVYSDKALGVGKVRVRESGILGVVPVTLPVDSEIAKRGSNHMATEIGLKNLLDMIEFDYRKAAPKGELKRKDHGIVDVDGHKVYKMESILPKDKSKGYYCYRMIHYIDYIRSLEIQAEVFNWNDELQESYLYTQIKLNAGLTDRDFDPANPDYDLE